MRHAAPIQPGEVASPARGAVLVENADVPGWIGRQEPRQKNLSADPRRSVIGFGLSPDATPRETRGQAGEFSPG